MIAFLLLLPVGLTLVWLYWLCLPGENSQKARWRWVDTVLLLSLMTLAGIIVYVALNAEYVNASPIWSEVVAATAGYGVITIGLAIGLIIRRQSAGRR